MILKEEIKDFLGSRARLTQTPLTEHYWIRTKMWPGSRDVNYYVKERNQVQTAVI